MIHDDIICRFGAAIVSAKEDGDELSLKINSSSLSDICLFLRDDPGCLFGYPADLAARDTGEDFVLWYRLYSTHRNATVTIETTLPRDEPVVDSITPIWPGFNWHEREAFDMLGIQFNGHPDSHNAQAMRILLPEDWEGHPFRKDYTPIFTPGGNCFHGPQEPN